MAGDNRAAMETFRAALAGDDLAALNRAMEDIAADDVVQEWPQSGERIRGKQGIKRLNESYSAATGKSPKMKMGRILAEGNLAVAEGTIDYGDGTPVSYVGIAEFRDGKLVKMTEYFANPFEAPAWRADMVEKMEPAAV